jgi:hypothetical protein
MLLSLNFYKLFSFIRIQNRFSYFIFSLCFLITFPVITDAKDILKINQSRSNKKPSSIYNLEVLHRAMKITEPEFGEYEIKFIQQGIPSSRMREMIKNGDIFNVTIKVSTPEWEQETVPIRIPIRRGILNYRLLLINKKNQNAFTNIKSLEQLKKKTVGLRRQWSTWQTMNELGFTIVDAFSYDSIFGMLNIQRFDYIPRGLHEIYSEIEVRKEEYQNLMVEPRLALFIPAPFYVFVSPKESRLISRLKLGLNRMAEQGILVEMVNNHYGNYLTQADLKNRVILKVGNPSLPPLTPLKNKELWLNWGNYSAPIK